MIHDVNISRKWNFLTVRSFIGRSSVQHVECSFVFCCRFILHAKKTAFVVEHDFIMATYLADRVIVFEGVPSVKTLANSYVIISPWTQRFARSLSLKDWSKLVPPFSFPVIGVNKSHFLISFQTTVSSEWNERFSGITWDHLPQRSQQLPTENQQNEFR